MKKEKKLHVYSPAEERINVISHGLGFILSIIALVALVLKAIQMNAALYLVSFSIFGVSLTVLYAASTIYHSSKNPALRQKLNIIDHACIFVLIAGTYTPFTLITLKGITGWIIFGIVWGVAITGIILKLFFTGRYNILSTIMYVAMGWIIIFAIKPLINNLPHNGLMWLAAGGVFYTVGAVLYSIRKIKYNHAIFHIFVLLGSFSHFMSVWLYV